MICEITVHAYEEKVILGTEKRHQNSLTFI